MNKRVRNSLIVIAVLVVILGVGFGIYDDALRLPRLIRDYKDEILGRYAFYRGEKCFKAEVYEKATKYLKSSLRFDPHNPGAHLLLMKTYWARGLWEEMREERDKIIALGEEAPPIPLVIKDLEDAHITIARSAAEHGWVYNFHDYASSAFFTEEGNGQYDNQNVFHDGNSSQEALILMIDAFGDYCAMTVQAGDTLEITYDGGQKLTIYLPQINKQAGQDTYLYIARDGSTYYNEGLTELAGEKAHSF